MPYPVSTSPKDEVSSASLFSAEGGSHDSEGMSVMRRSLFSSELVWTTVMSDAQNVKILSIVTVGALALVLPAGMAMGMTELDERLYPVKAEHIQPSREAVLLCALLGFPSACARETPSCQTLKLICH